MNFNFYMMLHLIHPLFICFTLLFAVLYPCFFAINTLDMDISISSLSQGQCSCCFLYVKHSLCRLPCAWLLCTTANISIIYLFHLLTMVITFIHCTTFVTICNLYGRLLYSPFIYTRTFMISSIEQRSYIYSCLFYLHLQTTKHSYFCIVQLKEHS